MPQCSVLEVLGTKDPQRAPEPCKVPAQLLHTLVEWCKLLRTALLLWFLLKGESTGRFMPILHSQRLPSPTSACF